MISPSNLVSKHGGLAGRYTPMEESRALRILEENYGLLGTLKRFETEKDDTFRVITKDRQKFVLKIANSDETFGEIDFQHRILNHAEARDPTLPIPRIIETRDRRDIFQIAELDGTLRYVRMLSFIDGTPLCETQSNARERVKIGKMLARLRHSTEGFSHAHEDRYYAWDVQHLLTLEHLLDEVDSLEQRDLLSRGLERFRSIESRLHNCRKQVLHNDFSKSNIVVDHDDPSFVKGIIDFGDSVNTAIAVDVATALLNQLPETPSEDLFHHGRDIMEGYLSIAELTNEELALVPHLVMARIVTRALLTLWRAKLFPKNERYIMRNTEQGWHQLVWFLSRSPEQVSEVLMPFSAMKGPNQ
ncbi:MAG: phosphotransferase [Paracoccaceae bacterium]|nr:phosphotransferase [Paracoccaceae bacterium]